jgi:hypothetical protein
VGRGASDETIENLVLQFACSSVHASATRNKANPYMLIPMSKTMPTWRRIRACLKIPCSPVFGEKAARRGATREHTRQRSVTEEQRSQAAFSAKTLRAAGLLSVACVGSVVTARCGDAPPSPPWPQPKSLAAGLHVIFRHALTASDHSGGPFG